jgi:hypothetical protein
LQSTPLAASEIGAILTVRICYNGITIYLAARLKRNMFGVVWQPVRDDQ